MSIFDLYLLYPTRGLKCDACNLGTNNYSDGYRCFRSGLFFHKECINSNRDVLSLYHPQHPLDLKVVAENEDVHGECKLCRVLDDRFPYACNICDLKFHKDCAESTPELNYSCHPKHPLKRLTRVPSYIDGKCCLCGSKLHNLFYHCSICDFSVDVDCAENPPLFTLVHPKAHVHPLTFLPQRIFVCNACGIMDDDPNPYVCLQCNFMVHRNCIDIPRIIKINRHIHRIKYNHCLTPGDWTCGVCQKKISWTCGAYSCSKCPDFAIHMRCATRFGIWDGTEVEDILEDTIDHLKSYEVIEEGVIKYFSHEKHNLKLREEGDANDECMWCEACTYPIFCSPFYDCMECDDFIIHQKCANLPRKKIDSFYKMPMNLVPSVDQLNFCQACQNYFQGFMYRSDDGMVVLDVRCGSISEPFVHESHPNHSLYISYSTGDKFCNACGDKATMFLSCDCEECEFALDIKCSVLPKMVKHKNDKDHFLTLCYEGKTKEQYWCDICEEDLNQENWFYSCDHCDITFHVKCTLGDLWLNPDFNYKLYGFEVIPNNSVSRPVCAGCDSRCRFPFTLKFTGYYTVCSVQCFSRVYTVTSKDSAS
ncbi:uncharacterized protein LOC18030447 isoform X1 [Eutrema salsugineum]|uniref:uncharacterized protein LOC18030447 isoform X1 n=1 Tax=Eutrema salsugineum TaxID=72664 RepID=UPI000CED1F6A|nr:uncharacterized protein LOC18030447 isoform X1 [Eutrema salsugineum]